MVDCWSHWIDGIALLRITREHIDWTIKFLNENSWNESLSSILLLRYPQRINLQRQRPKSDRTTATTLRDRFVCFFCISDTGDTIPTGGTVGYLTGSTCALDLWCHGVCVGGGGAGKAMQLCDYIWPRRNVCLLRNRLLLFQPMKDLR